jgi:hypothetical protein
MKSDVYIATISWDGINEFTQGERTIYRITLEDLIEGIQQYLYTFESRYPYLECASVELRDGRNTIESKDLTESIKTIIKTKENQDNGSK